MSDSFWQDDDEALWIANNDPLTDEEIDSLFEGLDDPTVEASKTLSKHKCHCTIRRLMMTGCECGGE